MSRNVILKSGDHESPEALFRTNPGNVRDRVDDGGKWSTSSLLLIRVKYP